MVNALAAIRLSRLTDATTSPERQREVVTRWAEQNDAELVGEAVDLDVSGAVSPFDRDGLGKWLTDTPPHPWSVLVAWRLDRVSRSALDTLRLVEWLEARGKRLVTVSDGIDTGTSMGRLFVKIAGIFAELERDTIRERTAASRQALRAAGRWGGEAVHYGYKAVPRDEGGYILEIDEEAAQNVRDMFNDVLKGRTVARITRELNERGILAPRDRQRSLRGQDLKGDRWSESTVWDILQSKALLGWTTHNGEADPNNLKAPPIITSELFERVQIELSKRKRAKTRNPGKNSSPLSGVALCWECLKPLWHRGQTMNGKLYRYYHCPNKHTKSIRAEELEKLCEAAFLAAYSNIPVREPVEIPASDHTEELAAVRLAVKDLAQRMSAARSDVVRDALSEQLASLDARAEELAAIPVEPARIEYRETGRTWKQELSELDTEGKRDLWLRVGFGFAVQSTEDGFTVAFQPPQELLDAGVFA